MEVPEIRFRIWRLHSNHRERSSMKGKKMTLREKKELRIGLIVILPWIIGFVCFMLIPLIYSFFVSFTNYSFLSSPQFVGLQNYITMFVGDELIWKSLGITFSYAIIAVSSQLVVGFLIALLLNSKVKGIAFFRAVFYIPTLVVVVATSLLWKQILDSDFGIFNYLLEVAGLKRVRWLSSTPTILASLVIIHLWGCGKSMIINLAGMQSIPTQLYEAATVDGCGKVRQVFSIMIPMMSPTIFLNLITGIISAFKTFTMVQVLTDGGPNNASLFYMLYLYKNAFQYYRMGYASAMSWFLFILVAVLTLLVFKTSKSWVYYEG